MRNCLVIFSLILISCFSAKGQEEKEQEYVQEELSFTMQIKDYNFSGMCIMNIYDIEGDKEIVGTIVNQFGVKALDFTFTRERVKILNVIAPIDKWYIRKILRRDFYFILTNLWSADNVEKRGRKFINLPNGEKQITNKHLAIEYTFSPMQN